MLTNRVSDNSHCSIPNTCYHCYSDGGTSNVKLNSSDPSAIVSLITCTLTLLIVIPAANVAVSVVVAKSTPCTC